MPEIESIVWTVKVLAVGLSPVSMQTFTVSKRRTRRRTGTLRMGIYNLMAFYLIRSLRVSVVDYALKHSLNGGVLTLV